MSEPGKNSSENDQDSVPENVSVFNLGDELLEYLERESLGYHVYPGVERVDYDFTAERLNMFNTNLVEATAHLIKGCLGAGFLSMHIAYMYGGLWTSLAATIVIAMIVFHCMLILVKSAQKMYVRLRISRLSYASLAEVAVATAPWKHVRRFSKLFRYIIDCFLFIELCGTCCIYEIMIAKTVKQAVETLSSNMKDMNLSERSYILMITLPLLMLCLIRNLKYLAPFSLAADIFIALCVCATMYLSISEADYIYERSTWKSVHGLLRFIGIYLFSIDGVGVSLAVENNMRQPKDFSIVLQYGLSLVLICVTGVGFFGYWIWGEKCRTPVTMHLPLDTVPLILQFLMAIMLSVTFAIHFWVPFRIVWRYIHSWHKRKKGTWEWFYRIVHVLLITCVSVAIPNIIYIMLFLGNFFLVHIALTFPALIECLITWREPHRGIRWILIKNCFLISLGVFLSIASFYSMLEI